jgi:hypothetical protein
MATVDLDGGPPALRIDLKNKRPVELLDLSASFEAFALEYQDFARAQGRGEAVGDIRLYIEELRGGSIIAVLKELADQATFFHDHAEFYAAFLGNFDELVKFFLSLPPSSRSERPISKIQARRVAQILEPVAKDGGAQLNLTIQGDVKIEIHHHYNSQEANAVQNNVRRYVGAGFPQSANFSGEVLYLSRASGDPTEKIGDRGIIEKFSARPIKLHFMSEAAKKAVVEVSGNPFKLAYLVDGEVSTVDGAPGLYKIYYVHESFDRP